MATKRFKQAVLIALKDAGHLVVRSFLAVTIFLICKEVGPWALAALLYAYLWVFVLWLCAKEESDHVRQ